MNPAANPVRGEATLHVAGTPRLLRPTFAALVAAEDELGSLFALVERAGAGELRLSELATLFWHCLADRDRIGRDEVGDAIAALGFAACTRPLRILLEQILKGSA